MTGKIETKSLSLHPLASLFPAMTAVEFRELVQDIGQHGIHEPLLLIGKQILDGRHRWRAAGQLDLPTVPTREWAGAGTPLEAVVSLNLHRRHLSESQRAMVGARVLPMFEERAKERQATSTGGSDPQLVANLPQAAPAKARDQAAALVNVSPRSVQSAAKVIRDGAPDLVAAVDADRVAVSVAAEIAKEQPEEQRAILASKDLPHRALRLHRAAKKQAALVQYNDPLPVPLRRYTVILADPPWRYEFSPAASRSVENHYPTMALDDIRKMPVGDLAHKDAVLFMWSTGPKLGESLSVVNAWGFTHRTAAVWDKQKIGMDHYFRQQTEMLLVATRGTPLTPPTDARVSSLISSPRGQHSVKPAEVYEIIEAMYPNAPRLELFARNRREGWDAWGNQAEEQVAP